MSGLGLAEGDVEIVQIAARLDERAPRDEIRVHVDGERRLLSAASDESVLERREARSLSITEAKPK